MESKKISQLATELTPDLSDLTIIGDPTTGISKKITLSQMASLFTGTVEEYANLAAFPLVGVADTIYIALDTNIIYRYDTSLSTYVVLSPNIINSLVFSDANGFDGTITLVGSVATLSITTALTLGSVPFIGASGALIQDNANLFFDDTNNRLGIATALPTTPLDVFGSGIIGRLNATSTNNAFLGFASNGTNKWSAGNVQSDHRFRIFSEANSAELITILQTGEFGIGIANPTTKFHIDGAASALIANLDANVSVAKSVSFRSDNSARINLEVSGTESGSNVGADFFLRTFTDAGSLLETPFTIVRSTGVTTIKSLTLTNALSVANGGTGSATQNFVDLTTTQTAAGAKTFSAITTISNATASTSTTTGALVVTGGVGIGGALFGTSAKLSSFLNIGASTTTGKQLIVNQTGASGYFLSGEVSGTEIGYWYYDASTIQLSSKAATRALTFLTTDTERMRISSGGDIRITGGGATTSATLEFSSSATPSSGASIAVSYLGSGSYGPLTFGTGGAERMRITSAGYTKATSTGSYNDTAAANHEFVNGTASANSFFVGNTNTSYSGATLVRINGSRTTTNATYNLIGATNGNSTGEFLVRDSGNVQNTNNSYTATSDIKLKQDIIDSNSQWDDIKKMRIRKFRFKKQVEQDENAPYLLGVIAQELELVSPNLVDEALDFDGTGEEVTSTTKSVKYSIIYMKAVKALQEAMEKIEILEEKVKQLELK